MTYFSKYVTTFWWRSCGMAIAQAGLMARKNLIRSDIFPYHLTARANNKELFPASLDEMWKITTDELYLLTLTHDVEIHAFVLMPNHFHLLLTVPKEDLGTLMNRYMAAVSKAVNRKTGRSGRTFGGPYHWSIITCTRYYGHAFKYIYRNPVRAGICIKVEEYRFSTLHGLLGYGPSPFPLTYTRVGMEINMPEHENTQSWLDWLNRPFPSEAEKLIQKFFKKTRIEVMNDRSTRAPVDELAQFL